MAGTKNTEAAAQETEEKQETAAQGEKMVKIRLFKDSRTYTEDVFVGVNGRTFQIKRGVEVEVPECVAEVLRNSGAQDEHAVSLMDDLQRGAEW